MTDILNRERLIRGAAVCQELREEFLVSLKAKTVGENGKFVFASIMTTLVSLSGHAISSSSETEGELIDLISEYNKRVREKAADMFVKRKSK